MNSTPILELSVLGWQDLFKIQNLNLHFFSDLNM